MVGEGVRVGETGTEVNSTHPTGMYLCLNCNYS